MNINNDISMNIIYNELLKMYNNHFNKSTIVEPFITAYFPNQVKDYFIRMVIRAKNYGYDINFTIDELTNVFKTFELRANKLTFEQQETRKKVFINIKDILNKFKEKNHLWLLSASNIVLSKSDQEDYALSLLDKNDISTYLNFFTPINFIEFHSLLLNVVDLFIEEIENISKNIKELTIKEDLTKKNEDLTKKNEDLTKKNENLTKKNEELNIKINNTNIITILLVILLVIVILFYLKK